MVIIDKTARQIDGGIPEDLEACYDGYLRVIAKDKLVSEVTGQYKSMFPPRGGLSEFYIWDNSFEVRYRANHEYEQIKLQIEAILSKCK